MECLDLGHATDALGKERVPGAPQPGWTDTDQVAALDEDRLEGAGRRTEFEGPAVEKVGPKVAVVNPGARSARAAHVEVAGNRPLLPET
jgi:hypothetical protein